MMTSTLGSRMRSPSEKSPTTLLSSSMTGTERLGLAAKALRVVLIQSLRWTEVIVASPIVPTGVE